MPKRDLRSFNLYEYLKEQSRHSMTVPYFLANQEAYKDASVRFPFRTFTYGIGITYKGAPGLFKIGSADFEVKTGCLTTIGPGIVSQWTGDYMAVHDTVFFTEELFANTLKVSFLKSLPFFQPGGNHVTQLSKEEFRQVKTLVGTIKTFREEKHVMPGLIYALLVLVSQIHKMHGTGGVASHQEGIAGRFRGLLARRFNEQKEVSYYASELNITPKYLSEILLAQTGKPAKTLIDEHIAMEAKSLLRQTGMTVQEIAGWLGYEDVSYFVKTFKKWEGLTPVGYRKL